MTFVSGDIYQGEYRNNVFHGKGYYKYRNGANYTGDFIGKTMINTYTAKKN